MDRVHIAGVRNENLAWVESDALKIVDQIREIDPNLYVVVHKDNKEKPFVVMENCVDGCVRMVGRYEALDQRILADLRYMLAVPYEVRAKELSDRIQKENEEKEKFSLDSEEGERFLWEFRNALKEANMIDAMYDSYYGARGNKKRNHYR